MMTVPAALFFFAALVALPASAVRPPVVVQNSAVKIRLAMTPREMLHNKWESGGGGSSADVVHRRDQHTAVDHARGIVLWSLGRSGTSAFWDSMDMWTQQVGVTLHLVCGKKEGFLAEKASRLRLHR